MKNASHLNLEHAKHITPHTNGAFILQAELVMFRQSSVKKSNESVDGNVLNTSLAPHRDDHLLGKDDTHQWVWCNRDYIIVQIKRHIRRKSDKEIIIY